MTDAITAYISDLPPEARARLEELRTIILEAAVQTDTAPLTQTLKWGQPAFLPARRAGTTIRLNWSPKHPERCEVLVHCQTTLIEHWRHRYPDAFTYDGNRAVQIPTTGPIAQDVLHQMAAMALTYHRNKSSKAVS